MKWINTCPDNCSLDDFVVACSGVQLEMMEKLVREELEDEAKMINSKELKKEQEAEIKAEYEKDLSDFKSDRLSYDYR